MLVENRSARNAARGKRVRLNEHGLRWAMSSGPQNPREWRGREGVVMCVSMNRTQARVRWEGCKAGYYVPLILLEEIS